MASSDVSLLPTLFISHGAGPAWFIDSHKESIDMLKDIDMHSPSADAMRNLRSIGALPRTPRAILVISAHWEETDHTVLTASHPSLYFDYYGFPSSTYQLEWPVPGEPSVARSVIELLTTNGIRCHENSSRGLDHGVFIPLKLAYPDADIPVLQVSLKSNLDINDHLRLGEALRPLRADNVLIIGSGSSTHRAGLSLDDQRRFMTWFHDLLTNGAYSPDVRKQMVLSCRSEPVLSLGHERIEHFLPSLVACAAASYQPGRVIYEDSWMSHVKFD